MASRLRETLRKSPSLKKGVQAARRVNARMRKHVARAIRGSKIRDYLNTHSVRKLQIGALGNLLDGWLNSDLDPAGLNVVYLDATRPFPLPDSSIDYIFTEHQIEHIEYEQSQFMLRECFRILKPGGRIRIATPNLEFLARLTDPNKTDVQKRYIDWSISQFFPRHEGYESFVINNFFYNFHHRFIFDPQTMTRSLTLAGFTSITRHRSGESDDQHLRGIDSHARYVGEEFNELESMIFEAAKPR
jgi:predicted SAM-dependent methyltransferase